MTQQQHTPPSTPLSNINNNNDSIVNNDEQQYIITITDEEEGIEIPLPITNNNDNNNTTNNNYNYDKVSHKAAPLTPNTTVTPTSSSDDSFYDNEPSSANKNNKATSLSTWLSSLDNHLISIKHKKKSIVVITLSLLALSLIIIVWTVYFVKSSSSNNISNDYYSKKMVERVGNNHIPSNVFPLVECQGDCDTDDDCNIGLICYQRSSNERDGNGSGSGYMSVPGCSGGELDKSGTDYCVREELVELSAKELSEEQLLVGGEEDDYYDDDDITEQQIPASTTTIQQAPTSSPYPTTSNSPTNSPRDLFLLSGQSNMVGHTTSGQSIGGNANYWDEILSILNKPNIVAKTTAAAAEAGAGAGMSEIWPEMYNLIYEMNYQKRVVAKSLTSGLLNMLLHNGNSTNSSSSSSSSNLLTGLDIPLSNGKCSFMEAYENENGKSKVDDISLGTQPIAWDANCGHTFGHELTFGRSLELEFEYEKEFELIKVARGGSGLYEHWYPDHGLHWHLLRNTIIERGNEGSTSWKGFVWHQGSQAAWSEREYGEDRSLTYLGNLTGLVDEVRTLMFDNSNVKVWQCKEEIPVVIVQVGYWPADNAAGQRVRDAQAKLCDEDPRAVLVKTDDLSRFYHYDAVSFLITGRRIAYAYKEALEGVVECPKSITDVPSSPPSKEEVDDGVSSSSVPSVSIRPTTVTKSSVPSMVRREEDTTDPI